VTARILPLMAAIAIAACEEGVAPGIDVTDLPDAAADAAKDTYLRLDDPVTAGEGVRTPQCDVFDSIVGWAL
jgi:hypothetical protein